MGTQLITDFNPTQKLYAVGDDNHIEVLMEGSYQESSRALITVISRFIWDFADKAAETIDEEEMEQAMEKLAGKDLSKKDVAVMMIWHKLQDDVNRELCKLKIKSTLDIPDVIKKIIPESIIDGFVNDAISKIENGVKEDEDDE